MSTVEAPLKYRWVALYDDSTSLEQPEDDKSRIYPEENGFQPSAFRDINHDKLMAFTLTDGETYYSVDLKTGLFMINEHPFQAHDQYWDLVEPLRLIFHRQVKQHTIGSVMQPKYIDMYFLGWQTTINGKNRQAVIGIPS